MSSADQYVEIDKQKFPDHVPRRGIDILLRKNDANYVAKDRPPVQDDNCLTISDIFWTAHKWVCQRKDLPTVTPAESAPVFPLIDWQKYSQTDIETTVVHLIVKRLGMQKHSASEIETALAWLIADRLEMPATRVSRADVEAAIAQALADKND
jgi:hypothetical protein